MSVRLPFLRFHDRSRAASATWGAGRPPRPSEIILGLTLMFSLAAIIALAAVHLFPAA